MEEYSPVVNRDNIVDSYYDEQLRTQRAQGKFRPWLQRIFFLLCLIAFFKTISHHEPNTHHDFTFETLDIAGKPEGKGPGQAGGKGKGKDGVGNVAECEVHTMTSDLLEQVMADIGSYYDSVEDKFVEAETLEQAFQILDVDCDGLLQPDERKQLTITALTPLLSVYIGSDDSVTKSHFCNLYGGFEVTKFADDTPDEVKQRICNIEDKLVHGSCDNDWNTMFPGEDSVSEELFISKFVEELGGQETWTFAQYYAYRTGEDTDHIFSFMTNMDREHTDFRPLNQITEYVNEECTEILGTRRRVFAMLFVTVSTVLFSSLVTAAVMTGTSDNGWSWNTFGMTWIAGITSGAMTAIGCSAGAFGCIAGGAVGHLLGEMVKDTICALESNDVNSCFNLADYVYAAGTGAASGTLSAVGGGKVVKLSSKILLKMQVRSLRVSDVLWEEAIKRDFDDYSLSEITTTIDRSKSNHGAACAGHCPLNAVCEYCHSWCCKRGQSAGLCEGHGWESEFFSRSGNCEVSLDCVSSRHYPTRYWRGDTCTVTILKRTKVNLGDTFALGYYDELKINGVRIRTKSAVDTILNKGTVISWVASPQLRSNSQWDPKNGWQMCFGEDTHKFQRTPGFCPAIGCEVITTLLQCREAGNLLGLLDLNKGIPEHNGGRLPGCFFYSDTDSLEFNHKLDDTEYDWDNHDSICICPDMADYRAYVTATEQREQAGFNCWKSAGMKFFSDTDCNVEIEIPPNRQISSGYNNEHPIEHAFDGKTDTYWEGRGVDGLHGSRAIWIGAKSVSPKCIKMYQNDGTECRPRGKVYWQRRETGANNWADVGEMIQPLYMWCYSDHKFCHGWNTFKPQPPPVSCSWDTAYHNGPMVNQNADANSPRTCQEACVSDARCNYWDFGEGHCRLRNSAGSGGALTAAGYRSGTKHCQFDVEVALGSEEIAVSQADACPAGFELAFSHLNGECQQIPHNEGETKVTGADDLNACANACTNAPQCYAFDFKDGSCYLNTRCDYQDLNDGYLSCKKVINCNLGKAYSDGPIVNDNANANSAQGCQAACASNLSCNYWDFGEGRCRLRSGSGTGGAMKVAKYISGEKHCQFGTCGLDKAYHNGPVLNDNANADSAQDCQQVCASDPRCNYWDFGKDRCRLRSGSESIAQPDTGYIFGEKYCEFDASHLCRGRDDGCFSNLRLGDGDCDQHSDCRDNLICGDNNCGDFWDASTWPQSSLLSWDPNDDCCVKPEQRDGVNNVASWRNLQLGDGDCDKDYQCAGDLVCGSNNCNDFRDSEGWPVNEPKGWDQTDDCCKERGSMVAPTRYYVSSAEGPDRFKVSTDPECCGWTDQFWFHAYDSYAAGTTRYYVSEASNPHRFKISKQSECCGWTRVFSFWAFDKGVKGIPMTRYYVTEKHSPHRFQISLEPACCGWTDVFSFLADKYVVGWHDKGDGLCKTLSGGNPQASILYKDENNNYDFSGCHEACRSRENCYGFSPNSYGNCMIYTVNVHMKASGIHNEWNSAKCYLKRYFHAAPVSCPRGFVWSHNGHWSKRIFKQNGKSKQECADTCNAGCAGFSYEVFGSRCHHYTETFGTKVLNPDTSTACKKTEYEKTPGLCPGIGCEVITTKAECRRAANELGLPSERILDHSSNRPPGCFHYVEGNTVEFNTNLEDSSNFVTTDSICKCSESSSNIDYECTAPTKKEVRMLADSVGKEQVISVMGVHPPLGFKLLRERDRHKWHKYTKFDDAFKACIREPECGAIYRCGTTFTRSGSKNHDDITFEVGGFYLMQFGERLEVCPIETYAVLGQRSTYSDIDKAIPLFNKYWLFHGKQSMNDGTFLACNRKGMNGMNYLARADWTVSFDTGGWSVTDGLIAGLYRGVGNTINRLEESIFYPHTTADVDCVEESWDFSQAGHLHCPSDMGLSALYRSTNDANDHGLNMIQKARCCKGVHNRGSGNNNKCRWEDVGAKFDHPGLWRCMPGFAICGFDISWHADGTGLKNIERFHCCPVWQWAEVLFAAGHGRIDIG